MCSVAQMALAGDGVAGVQGTGNAILTSTVNGSLSVNFLVTGTANGGTLTAGTVIPNSWLFTITDSDPTAVLTWQLAFSADGISEVTSGPNSATSGVPVSGSKSTNPLPAIPVTSYGIDLDRYRCELPCR